MAFAPRTVRSVRTVRTVVWAGVVQALLVASPAGSEGEGAPPLEGLYELHGSTVVVATGEERLAQGKVVVAPLPEAGRFEISVNLQTQLETPGGWRRVDITGSGELRQEGAALSGHAETQWLMAAIPGVDPRFGFIPGKLGPRIVSTIRMEPRRHEPGSWDVQVETIGKAGEAGQGYSPTRSTFVSTRVGDEPEGRRLPLPRPHDD